MNIDKGQDETGRFYYSARERRQASGRMVEVYLLLKREDSEIGTVLVRERWLYGGANFAHMGPIKWTRYLERNLDAIIERAMRYFKKQDKTFELIAVEGWRITDKKTTSTHNMFFIDAS